MVEAEPKPEPPEVSLSKRKKSEIWRRTSWQKDQIAKKKRKSERPKGMEQRRYSNFEDVEREC